MARLSTKVLGGGGGGGLSEAQVNALIRAHNGYLADVKTYRDHWLYAGATYYSLQGGNPVHFGDYTTDWTNNARIVALTGTGRLGVVALQTGDLEECRCRVRTNAMGAFDSAKYASISFEAVVAFEALATGVQDYYAEIGLVGNRWASSDNLGDLRGFMHGFRYNRSAGGAKWMAVNRDLDVETAVILDGTTQGGIATVDAGTITALSLPASGFFRLKVIATANPSTGAGASAAYYVNDVLCATITTNMVTHSLAGSVSIQKTVGTTSRYLALDYTELSYTMLDGEDHEP